MERNFIIGACFAFVPVISPLAFWAYLKGGVPAAFITAVSAFIVYSCALIAIHFWTK